MKEEEPKNAEAIIKDICRKTKHKITSIVLNEPMNLSPMTDLLGHMIISY